MGKGGSLFGSMLCTQSKLPIAEVSTSKSGQVQMSCGGRRVGVYRVVDNIGWRQLYVGWWYRVVATGGGIGSSEYGCHYI